MGGVGILLVAETFGQGEELLLFLLLGTDAAFDQFEQHAVLAQLAALGHAADLLGQPGRQADALADDFLSPLHGTSMHQDGVQTQKAGGSLRYGNGAYNDSRESQMPEVQSSLLERITIDPDVRFGKACIRGHRITVEEILEWLSGGASQTEILGDYPQFEPDDFLAVYAYAAELAQGAAAGSGEGGGPWRTGSAG